MANIFTQCLCSKFSIYRQNIDFLFVANQCKYDDKCLNNTNDKYFAISHDKKKNRETAATKYIHNVSANAIAAGFVHWFDCKQMAHSTMFKRITPIKAGGKNDDTHCYSMQL